MTHYDYTPLVALVAPHLLDDAGNLPLRDGTGGGLMLVSARPLGFITRCGAARNSCAGPFAGGTVCESDPSCPQITDAQPHGVVRFEHVRVHKTLVMSDEPVSFAKPWDVVCGCSQSRSMWRFPPMIGVQGVELVMLLRSYSYVPTGAPLNSEMRRSCTWSAAHASCPYFMEAWLGWSVVPLRADHGLGAFAFSALRHFVLGSGEVVAPDRIALAARNIVAHANASHHPTTIAGVASLRQSMMQMKLHDLDGLFAPSMPAYKRVQTRDHAAQSLMQAYANAQVEYVRKQPVCMRHFPCGHWGAGAISAILEYVGYGWNAHASACSSAVTTRPSALHVCWATAAGADMVLLLFCAAPMAFLDHIIAYKMAIHDREHAPTANALCSDTLSALEQFTKRGRDRGHVRMNNARVIQLSQALYQHMRLDQNAPFQQLLAWVNGAVLCDACNAAVCDQQRTHVFETEKTRAWRLVHATPDVSMHVLQCCDFVSDAQRVVSSWIAQPDQTDVLVMVPNIDLLLHMREQLYPCAVYYPEQLEVHMPAIAHVHRVRLVLTYGHLWSVDDVERLHASVRAHTQAPLHLFFVYAMCDPRNLCWFAEDELHRALIKETYKNPERVPLISLPVHPMYHQTRPHSSQCMSQMLAASMGMSATRAAHPWSCLCDSAAMLERARPYTSEKALLVTGLMTNVCHPMQVPCDAGRECMVLSALAPEDSAPSALGVGRLVAAHTQRETDRFPAAMFGKTRQQPSPFVFDRSNGRSFCTVWYNDTTSFLREHETVSICTCDTPFARLFECHKVRLVVPPGDTAMMRCVRDVCTRETLGCAFDTRGASRVLVLYLAHELTLTMDAEYWRWFALSRAAVSKTCMMRHPMLTRFISDAQKINMVGDGGAIRLPHVREYKGPPVRCVMLLVSARSHPYDLVRACLASREHVVFMPVDELANTMQPVSRTAIACTNALMGVFQSTCARSSMRPTLLLKRRAMHAAGIAKRVLADSTNPTSVL